MSYSEEVYCKWCEDFVHDDDYDSNIEMCDWCKEDHAVSCFWCDELLVKQDAILVNGHHYCDDGCASEHALDEAA